MMAIPEGCFVDSFRNVKTKAKPQKKEVAKFLAKKAKQQPNLEKETTGIR